MDRQESLNRIIIDRNRQARMPVLRNFALWGGVLNRMVELVTRPTGFIDIDQL
jgi:hypothetical protein